MKLNIFQKGLFWKRLEKTASFIQLFRLNKPHDNLLKLKLLCFLGSDYGYASPPYTRDREDRPPQYRRTSRYEDRDNYFDPANQSGSSSGGSYRPRGGVYKGKFPRSSFSSTKRSAEHTPKNGKDQDRRVLNAPKKAKIVLLSSDEDAASPSKSKKELEEELAKTKLELEEKETELVAKTKENARQVIEYNTLKKQKDKKGTLDQLEHTRSKNKKLEISNTSLKETLNAQTVTLDAHTVTIAGQKAEIETLKNTLNEKEKKGGEDLTDLKRYRSERDALRKSAAILENKMKLLQKDLNKRTSTLERVREERDPLLNEPNTSTPKTPVAAPIASPTTTPIAAAVARPKPLIADSVGDSEASDDSNSDAESIDADGPNREDSGAASEAEESAEADVKDETKDLTTKTIPKPQLIKPVIQDADTEDPDDEKAKKDKHEKARKKKKTKKAEEDDIMKDFEIEALKDDDSFMNPPSSVRTVGKFQVKNFQTRSSKDPAPHPEDLKYANQKPAATCLNNKISFVASSEPRKTKHDHGQWGDRPCALYPVCSNIFRGQEDIGRVKIISPDFHANLNEDGWACWYHVDASLNGIEVQTQAKFVIKDTPKTTKSKKVGITAAPTKKVNLSNKPRFEAENSPDAKAKLESKLDAK